ncbi:MAG TPA: GAF domain-containing sensor histidine kinase, partial [Acidimicrobiales bacterium]|nr:GAF domain-containing sensor histidine kinase [Acidimicrobiales bacterium]
MLAHLRSSRPRISGAVRVWCLTGVLVAISSALLLMTAESIPAPIGRIHVPWWMLAAGFAVTEVFVLDVGRSGNERWLSLSEVPLVVGLVFSTPATIVAAQALGVGAVLVLYRRQRPLRCAFDVAHRATTTLVAVFVFVPIIQVAGSTWPIIWLAAFAATLSADLVDGILNNAAVALSESSRMRFDHVVGVRTALTLAKTGLALVVVMVMTQYPAGLVVVAIPVAAVFLAGGAHVKVRRERDDMVLLQRATGLAQRSLHPDEMLPLLLQHLRDMFHADIAELVLPDQKAKDHLASRVGPGGAVAILTPIDLDPTQGVWARVTAEGEGVLLARPIRNPLLAEHFNSLGINDAIVAPVSCEDGPPAILTVANRIGDLATFGSDDLHLLEALAKHIGVTIRNSRLTLRLEEALEREAETNKLKEDFLATISHELRSPLTSMHGYVKTMRDAGDGMTEKEREEFLAAADRAGERLHSLIEDLLFTSVETPVSSDRLSPVGLAGLVGRVVEDRLEQLEPGRIVLRFPPSQPPVWTNEGEAKRIVSNLLDNALKYSPADTPVTVSAETDGAGVRVSFHNLGAKIPESERERIFDRFYQIEHGLTRSNGGIGLGLHICRRTAESLGGRVWLNESDDSGSVFCVWLP